MTYESLTVLPTYGQVPVWVTGGIQWSATPNFEIDKTEFLNCLEKAYKVVPKRELFSVLKNVKIEVLSDPALLRIVASDSELSIVITTDAVTVRQSGLAIFPAKKLLDIIRSATDEKLFIDVNAGGVATVAVGPTFWTLTLQKSSEYPALLRYEDVALHFIDRASFLEAIRSVKDAAAIERPSLMMLNVEAGLTGIPANDDRQFGKITACDGIRFQRARLEKNFPVSLQIPINAINAVDDRNRQGPLISLLEKSKLEKISVGQTDQRLVFKVGTDWLIINAMMAEFPDVEQLLLQPALRNKEVFNVDKANLITAIKRVKINADTDTSAITLRLETDLVRVESSDRLGNSSAECVEALWSTADKIVTVNYKFLLEMLDMYDGLTCHFLLGEDSKNRKSPVLLKNDDTGTVGIIQQMRMV